MKQLELPLPQRRFSEEVKQLAAKAYVEGFSHGYRTLGDLQMGMRPPRLRWEDTEAAAELGVAS